MKKNTFLLAILICYSAFSYGQANNEPSSQLVKSYSIAALKMNVLYRGVDNPISICASNISNNMLSYSVEGDGEIVETPEGLVVRDLLDRNVHKVSVHVFKGKGTDRKKLGEQVFRVKDLPAPNIVLSGMSYEQPYSISKKAFLINPYLVCRMPVYVIFEYNYLVLEFDMVCEKEGSEFILHSESNKLTQDMIEYIREVSSNTVIKFENTKVQAPGYERAVSSFAVTIE